MKGESMNVSPHTINETEGTFPVDVSGPGDSSAFSGSTTVAKLDASSKLAQIKSKLNIMGGAENSAYTGIFQDIEDFLKKPVTIASGSIQATDTPSTYSEHGVLSSILSSSRVADKLKGFYSMRATAVYTLQVNATRFQQGRYFLAFIPQGGTSVANDPRHVAWKRAHRYSLTQVSQLPHVEIDLPTESEVSIKIPFFSALTSFSVNSVAPFDTLGELGSVVLIPYSPLVSVAGSTTASYTLYGHLEDVELFGPCAPYSGRVVIKKKNRARNPSEEEESINGIGPIQSAFRKVSLAASTIGQVPLLSSVGANVSWAADIAAKTAGVFGWCRPLNQEPAKSVVRNLMAGIANVDSPDLSNPLSLSCKNSIPPLPGYACTDDDQMSFDYLKSIPSYWTSFTWSTSDSATHELFSARMNPSLFFNTCSEGGGTVSNFTPVCFLAHLFALYRGGVILTFKFVKTEFHSGRLCFSYNPYVNWGNNTTINAANSSFLHREFVDLRYSNEVSFEVPYVSNTPWLSTILSGEGGTHIGEFFGDISIAVLDPLVAPDTVSNNITVLCEVRGAGDLQFAVPRNVSMTPVIPSSIASSETRGTTMSQTLDLSIPTPPLAIAQPQSGIEAIGKSAATKVADVSFAESCIGESIISLRTLLKKYCLLRTGLTNPQGSSLSVIPTASSWTYSDGTELFPDPHSPDYYNLFSSIYQFSRGGVRLKFKHRVFTVQALYDAVLNFSTSYDDFSQTSISQNAGAVVTTENSHTLPRIAARSDFSGAAEVAVPMYNQTFARNCADQLCSEAVYAPFSYRNNTSYGRSRVYLTSLHLPLDEDMFRAGADDCDFSGFVSIPPMFITDITV